MEVIIEQKITNLEFYLFHLVSNFLNLLKDKLCSQLLGLKLNRKIYGKHNIIKNNMKKS